MSRIKNDSDKIADIIFLQTGFIPTFKTNTWETRCYITINNITIIIYRDNIESLYAHQKSDFCRNVNNILAQIIIKEYESRSNR